jgi:hypothetical protein
LERSASHPAMGFRAQVVVGPGERTVSYVATHARELPALVGSGLLVEADVGERGKTEDRAKNLVRVMLPPGRPDELERLAKAGKPLRRRPCVGGVVVRTTRAPPRLARPWGRGPIHVEQEQRPSSVV